MSGECFSKRLVHLVSFHMFKATGLTIAAEFAVDDDWLEEAAGAAAFFRASLNIAWKSIKKVTVIGLEWTLTTK